MTQPTFTEIEEVLGLRDRTHRHRIAEKYGIPIGSGDQAPDLKTLCRALFERLEEYGERPENTEQAKKKQAKLDEEILVLQERRRKLQTENEINEGHLVDIREFGEVLTELAGFVRKAGDILGRRQKLAGRDAQEIVNSAIEKFERKLSATFDET